MLTKSEKIQNTKNLKEVKNHLIDMDNEIENQYPQPNGKIFLHGSPITVSRYNESIKEYNQYAMIFNEYAKTAIDLKKPISAINTRKRTPVIEINDRIDFKFMLSPHTKVNINGKLDDRTHNYLAQYYGYTIDEYNWITVYRIKPLNAEFILQLINGIEG